MLEPEIEERFEALEQKLEELTSRLDARKPEPEEESGLIPGAEYDFVPSVEDKVIGTFRLRVGKIYKEDSLLGLTDEEWRLYSTPDEAHE